MSERMKNLLFGLFFVVFAFVCFYYCFGDATLILFGSIKLHGYLLSV